MAETVTQPPDGLPATLRFAFDPAPSLDIRRTLGNGIDAAHRRTVPPDARRFALLLRDADDRLVAGLGAALSWQWMFVDSLWVEEIRRGQGIGRCLLAHAEAHAVAEGCHSAWLDTFQARDFYAALGYAVFGELENYPDKQLRFFMRKRLADAIDAGGASTR